MTPFLQNTAALLGRLLLSQLFLMSGLNHLLNWSGTVGFMKQQGMGMEKFLGQDVSVVFLHAALALAVTFLILGGLSVLLGIYARFGAILLIVFLLLVTPIFHAFWTYTDQDPQKVPQMINFMKNAALGGGLLMIVAFGSGRYSITHRQSANLSP